MCPDWLRSPTVIGEHHPVRLSCSSTQSSLVAVRSTSRSSRSPRSHHEHGSPPLTTVGCAPWRQPSHSPQPPHSVYARSRARPNHWGLPQATYDPPPERGDDRRRQRYWVRRGTSIGRCVESHQDGTQCGRSRRGRHISSRGASGCGKYCGNHHGAACCGCGNALGSAPVVVLFEACGDVFVCGWRWHGRASSCRRHWSREDGGHCGKLWAGNAESATNVVACGGGAHRYVEMRYLVGRGTSQAPRHPSLSGRWPSLLALSPWGSRIRVSVTWRHVRQTSATALSLVATRLDAALVSHISDD